MKILGMDTTGAVCTVAVADGEKIVSEIYVERQMVHSRQLMPMVDQCLALAGMDSGAMDVLGVSVGPGSFTGVRIGVCAAKGLAHATGKPLAAISTLEALAANVADLGGQAVCPLIDARNGNVYGAVFSGGVRETEDIALHIDEFLQKLAGRRALFLGDGARVLEAQIREKIPEASFAPPQLAMQRAGSVCLLAARAAREGRLAGYRDVAPNYLRESGAVRKKGQL